MRRSENRHELDRRAQSLALRMMANGARTHTVMQWTGLSKYRVQQLSRHYRLNEGTQRRGVSPSQPAYFRQSPHVEAESLVFIFMVIELQVIPEDLQLKTRRAFPDLSRGERLMDAFECYCALLGEASLPLERAILLVAEYAKRKNLSLRYCEQCKDLMLTARFGRSIRCPFCRNDIRPKSPPRTLVDPSASDTREQP